MAKVPEMNRRRRALLSVTDKSGLSELAAQLTQHGYELIASGGTAGYLREQGHAVIDVSELTGFPEIFDGRVKTLHPVIHGGILGPGENAFAGVSKLGVQAIDVVCVNLYRFAEAVQARRPESEIIEKIDIGGPALLRAAAKNMQRVTVLPDPEYYSEFMAEIEAGQGNTSLIFRRRMAGVAFSRVAAYDAAIAGWLQKEAGETPRPADRAATARSELRYGENPHQKARLEIAPDAGGGTDLASCGMGQLGGKQLSYNNIVDLVAAVKLACDFDEPCCAVIKHTNPCGFGLGPAATALERALLCDPLSAFGGVFAFNRPLDVGAASVLNKMFLEIVAAPDFDAEVLGILRKKKNVRLVQYEPTAFLKATDGPCRAFGRISVWQEEDCGFPELGDWTLAAGSEPDAERRRALALAWRVCKHVKSNAVVLADPAGTLGIGAGQMSRVDSVRLAIRKANDQELPLADAVAASDGFFPFPDGIETLSAAGIRAVIAPQGSIRDREVADAADKLGVTLVFTERRHFRH